MDLVKRNGHEVDVFSADYTEDSAQYLYTVIDKYLTIDEQYLAEALGALFMKRSLEFFDRRKLQFDKDPYRRLTSEEQIDGSNYGAEYYKYLGYRLLVQTKKLTEEANSGREKEDCFDYRQMLVILYGNEVRRCITHPIANNFSF